ncbi:hypothetical protein LXL04_032542 [Taraxacum kok-saghyz]
MSSGNQTWTTVQRRNKRPPANAFSDATSFYVAGMSNGTMKNDIRRCFEGFGELVDVFMGKKKDTSENNFAFVKFINVQNTAELESSMQNITCAGKTLSVNLARYGRNRSPIATTKVWNGVNARPPVTSTHRQPHPPYRSNNSAYGGGRRSYADVIHGQDKPTVTQLATPIPLSDAISNRN